MNATFTISHTIDHGIIDELEVEFDDFRSRIASLSVQACGTLTDMFSPLGPDDSSAIIDIDELEFIGLERIEAPLVLAPVYEFAAA